MAMNLAMNKRYLSIENLAKSLGEEKTKAVFGFIASIVKYFFLVTT
jgi:hypothetical protein